MKLVAVIVVTLVANEMAFVRAQWLNLVGAARLYNENIFIFKAFLSWFRFIILWFTTLFMGRKYRDKLY